jgi:hypothetical protein
MPVFDWRKTMDELIKLVKTHRLTAGLAEAPPPEARSRDTFARCAGFNASRPFREGRKGK